MTVLIRPALAGCAVLLAASAVAGAVGLRAHSDPWALLLVGIAAGLAAGVSWPRGRNTGNPEDVPYTIAEEQRGALEGYQERIADKLSQEPLRWSREDEIEALIEAKYPLLYARRTSLLARDSRKLRE
ncbi:MAG: hypothetical protein M0R75_13595 [Dehalococcoidia bacterium]|nr:hypothetical protein [Dehalococcoidia bacterium]